MPHTPRTAPRHWFISYTRPDNIIDRLGGFWPRPPVDLWFYMLLSFCPEDYYEYTKCCACKTKGTHPEYV